MILEETTDTLRYPTSMMLTDKAFEEDANCNRFKRKNRDIHSIIQPMYDGRFQDLEKIH
jgi:hypothetical protein